MASPDTFNFTTGPSPLPDIGTLSYNGCTFSSLFASEVSGVYVKDEAQRTIKYVEYTLKVEGVATIPDNDPDLAPTTLNLRRMLSQQGGQLIYDGRGFDLAVNLTAATAAALGVNGTVRDVAWGPVPEVLSFQTLGGGGSAMVVWQCKVRIPELVSRRAAGISFGNIPVLQFNYESNVSYGEDGFTTLSVNGVLEIGMTRPTQQTRTLRQTADDARSAIDSQVMSKIDLARFRMTRRDFSLSRDKRTLTWSFQAEEKPYMDLPEGCTIARGSYSVRPAQQGMGLCNWLCTLRATYTVRADFPRRTSWLKFLLLLRTRMTQAQLGEIPKLKVNQNPQANGNQLANAVRFSFRVGSLVFAPQLATQQDLQQQNKVVDLTTKPMLIDFNIDEGLYLDSKTITFSATWRFVTSFSHILLASGIWRKVPERQVGALPDGQVRDNLWAISMKNVQGSKSWLLNQADAATDVIIDFGGGG